MGEEVGVVGRKEQVTSTVGWGGQSGLGDRSGCLRDNTLDSQKDHGMWLRLPKLIQQYMSHAGASNSIPAFYCIPI